MIISGYLFQKNLHKYPFCNVKLVRRKIQTILLLVPLSFIVQFGDSLLVPLYILLDPDTEKKVILILTHFFT